jgi:hypothetical protein
MRITQSFKDGIAKNIGYPEKDGRIAHKLLSRSMPGDPPCRVRDVWRLRDAGCYVAVLLLFRTAYQTVVAPSFLHAIMTSVAVRLCCNQLSWPANRLSLASFSHLGVQLTSGNHHEFKIFEI